MDTDRYGAIWKAALEKADLGDAGHILRPVARPCFRVATLDPDDYSDVGHSRIGGEPDLPVSFHWPLDEGAPMAFLAQINLSELAPGFDHALPSEGWLYFFLGRDEAFRDLAHCVYFFDGSVGALQRRAVPPEVAEVESYFGRVFTPQRVTFVPAFSIPYRSPVWPEVGRGMFDIPHVFYQERTQIRGYALSYNNDPPYEVYLHRNDLPWPGYGRQVTEDFYFQWLESVRNQGDEAKAKELEERLSEVRAFRTWLEHHEVEIEKWRPLLILESHRAAGMLWADAGHLQFMIQQDDLLARRFDNTHCLLSTT